MAALEFPKIWNVIDYIELILSNIDLIWESSYTGQRPLGDKKSIHSIANLPSFLTQNPGLFW